MALYADVQARKTAASRIVILAAASALSLVLAGCQTNTSETTSAIPVLESASEGSESGGALEAEVSAAASEPNETDADQATNTDDPDADAGQAQAVASAPARQSEDERLRGAVTQIAAIEDERGRNAAFQSVFSCYERAKLRDAPISLAKVCATQDFVLSRGRVDAGGDRDQLLIIAERAPQRIGALMELKGMGQSQFNQFGLFLNRVALPTYRQTQS
ncbi:MAG: hypothetical protein AAFO77_01475 [Pseudomonadota bacterium]